MNNNNENMYDKTDSFGNQKLKNRIVKQISHEFRTPLTSILGFAEILEEDIEINENQRIEYASYIRNEGLRLTKLVDDLMELDSLEQEQVDLHIKENEIQETALSALMLVADLAHSKFIHISIDLPNEPVLLKFDRDRIIQVIFQLLHNAIRFTKPDGLINLKVETTDTHVVISVQDSGPGIPEREIPYLFKKFGKLYHSNKEMQGSGIGLAIVKHIINQHHGDVDIQSQVGEGTTFTVRIPFLP